MKLLLQGMRLEVYAGDGGVGRGERE